MSIKEMVVEFSERTVADEVGLTVHPVAQPASARIFVVPASDEADEIAAAMLAQLLSASGHAAIPFPVDFARDEKLAIVAPRANDLFCISALPPFAFASAITLVRQLKLRFPRTRIIAGVWGFSGNTEKALQRFQQSRPDCLVTSLAAALSYAAETQADATALAPQQG